jgi:tRNA pseudouridine32 synthase / 23S rRNA pseudouridine746 synthase
LSFEKVTMNLLFEKGNSYFNEFKSPVDVNQLPDKFTFPFYYTPHPAAIQAVEELQEYLSNQTNWVHNFGLDKEQEGLVIGKMFGVLVVQKLTGELGYLAAFSGKLAGGNHHDKFVPPVFDVLTEDGFFRKEEILVNEITLEIQVLESNPRLLELRSLLENEQMCSERELSEMKRLINANKKARKQQRQLASKELSAFDFEELMERLRKESVKEQYTLKDLTTRWRIRLNELSEELSFFTNEISKRKEERKQRSATLQQQLFAEYSFVNAKGELRSLGSIFQATFFERPPAGAGECAAPKLLQYAYLNGLKPIALAEFWWGASPASEIRKHKHFYPACKGKCEPILSHMLQGLKVDDNPMLVNPAKGKSIEIVYEDEALLIVNKPAEFLSVPGKTIEDSVLSRIKEMYPAAKGPLLVHRLDMSTSGILLVAKTVEAYHFLQFQFIKRYVKKRYVALLEGVVDGDFGEIDLPLRLDIDDRPRQLVCYEHGKKAVTKWEVINRNETTTKVNFYPITGRTHQLRVHAAHPKGLNAAIVGDDLYGKKENRLHLHAAYIQFTHPLTKELVEFTVEAEF